MLKLVCVASSASMQPRLSRGYTRAGDYLFDSDDEAPVPKPLPARPQLGGKSLHPPPHKQLWTAARSAASAPMAKSIEKAITGNSRQHCTARLHPYKHPAVSATVHELAAPPPPFVSVAKPKPAKGCNKIPPQLPPLNSGTPWPMPPISKGFDNVGDGAPWRHIAVAQVHKKQWPMWGRGVTDLRPKARSSMVAGRLLRHAIKEAIRMIRNTRCEHKIGMCLCPYERFFYYQEPDSRWRPWLLALLASTTTREGSNIMEASLK